MSSSLFKCNFNECKKSFYRAFNATFACIGRKASDEVIVELVTKKCLPVLLYASEALPYNTSDFKSLDYVIDSTFRKIFVTNSKDVVKYCRDSFGIASLKDIIADRRKTFLQRLAKLDNLLCALWI